MPAGVQGEQLGSPQAENKVTASAAGRRRTRDSFLTFSIWLSSFSSSLVHHDVTNCQTQHLCSQVSWHCGKKKTKCSWCSGESWISSIFNPLQLQVRHLDQTTIVLENPDLKKKVRHLCCWKWHVNPWEGKRLEFWLEKVNFTSKRLTSCHTMLSIPKTKQRRIFSVGSSLFNWQSYYSTHWSILPQKTARVIRANIFQQHQPFPETVPPAVWLHPRKVLTGAQTLFQNDLH